MHLVVLLDFLAYNLKMSIILLLSIILEVRKVYQNTALKLIYHVLSIVFRIWNPKLVHCDYIIGNNGNK